jgi:hypothetical protein
LSFAIGGFGRGIDMECKGSIVSSSTRVVERWKVMSVRDGTWSWRRSGAEGAHRILTDESH